MMFEVRLYIDIKCPEGSGRAWRWIELPFVPTKGMELKGVDAHDIERYWEITGVVVAEVIWNHGPNHFDVNLEPIVHDEPGDYESGEDLAMCSLGKEWTFEVDVPSEDVADVQA